MIESLSCDANETIVKPIKLIVSLDHENTNEHQTALVVHEQAIVCWRRRLVALTSAI